MRREELELAADATEQAADVVDLILSQGISQAMNRFNRRASPAENEDPGANEES
jgi:hypothetical protein